MVQATTPNKLKFAVKVTSGDKTAESTHFDAEVECLMPNWITENPPGLSGGTYVNTGSPGKETVLSSGYGVSTTTGVSVCDLTYALYEFTDNVRNDAPMTDTTWIEVLPSGDVQIDKGTDGSASVAIEFCSLSKCVYTNRLYYTVFTCTPHTPATIADITRENTYPSYFVDPDPMMMGMETEVPTSPVTLFSKSALGTEDSRDGCPKLHTFSLSTSTGGTDNWVTINSEAVVTLTSPDTIKTVSYRINYSHGFSTYTSNVFTVTNQCPQKFEAQTGTIPDKYRELGATGPYYTYIDDTFFP